MRRFLDAPEQTNGHRVPFASAASVPSAEPRPAANGTGRGRRDRSRIDNVVRALLPWNRDPTAEDWTAAKLWARGWRDAGFRGAEVQAWLQAGADVPEHGLAAWCLHFGLLPADAANWFQDPHGEWTSVLGVVRRATGVAWHERRASIGKALDEAGRTYEWHDDVFWHRRRQA